MRVFNILSFDLIALRNPYRLIANNMVTIKEAVIGIGSEKIKALQVL